MGRPRYRRPSSNSGLNSWSNPAFSSAAPVLGGAAFTTISPRRGRTCSQYVQPWAPGEPGGWRSRIEKFLFEDIALLTCEPFALFRSPLSCLLFGLLGIANGWAISTGRRQARPITATLSLYLVLPSTLGLLLVAGKWQIIPPENKTPELWLVPTMLLFFSIYGLWLVWSRKGKATSVFTAQECNRQNYLYVFRRGGGNLPGILDLDRYCTIGAGRGI